MKRSLRLKVSALAFLVFCTSCGIAAMKIREKQSEAITYLSSIATAEISYHSEANEWGNTFKIIGWEPSGETLYAYFLNSCEEVVPATDGFKECPGEIKRFFEQCRRMQEAMKKVENGREFFPMQFCAAAVANLDKDEQLDMWIIDNHKEPVQYYKMSELRD